MPVQTMPDSCLKAATTCHKTGICLIGSNYMAPKTSRIVSRHFNQRADSEELALRERNESWTIA